MEEDVWKSLSLIDFSQQVGGEVEDFERVYC